MFVMQSSNFAEKLKSYREARGLTKYRLAKLTGVSEAYLGQLEKGKGQPSAETVLKIAEALEAPYAALRAAVEADRFGDDFAKTMPGADLEPSETLKPWPLHDLGQASAPQSESVTGATDDKELSIWAGNAIGNDDEAAKINTRTGIVSGQIVPVTADFGAMKRLPVYRVSCGKRVFINDSPEEWQSWPVVITGPVDGILRVEGDSMLGAGIRPGDAIFYQAINGHRPSPGDTVVAEVDGGAVCKLYQRDDSGEYLVSAPGDTDDRAFFCRVTADVRLVGIVKKHLRDI